MDISNGGEDGGALEHEHKSMASGDTSHLQLLKKQKRCTFLHHSNSTK